MRATAWVPAALAHDASMGFGWRYMGFCSRHALLSIRSKYVRPSGDLMVVVVAVVMVMVMVKMEMKKGGKKEKEKKYGGFAMGHGGLY